MKTPFFWVAGTDDGDFSPDMWQRSINITPGTKASSLVVKLGHSDGGQAYPLIADMMGSVLRKETPLPRLERPIVDGRKVTVKYQSEKPLLRVDLCYTTDRLDRAQRVWQTSPAKIQGGVIITEIPEGMSAFFLNVYDKDGAVAPQGDAWPVSSEYIERP